MKNKRNDSVSVADAFAILASVCLIFMFVGLAHGVYPIFEPMSSVDVHILHEELVAVDGEVVTRLGVHEHQVLNIQGDMLIYREEIFNDPYYQAPNIVVAQASTMGLLKLNTIQLPGLLDIVNDAFIPEDDVRAVYAVFVSRDMVAISFEYSTKDGYFTSYRTGIFMYDLEEDRIEDYNFYDRTCVWGLEARGRDLILNCGHGLLYVLDIYNLSRPGREFESSSFYSERG